MVLSGRHTKILSALEISIAVKEGENCVDGHEQGCFEVTRLGAIDFTVKDATTL